MKHREQLNFLFTSMGLVLVLFLNYMVKGDTAIDEQNMAAKAFLTVVAPSSDRWSVTAPNFDFGTQLSTERTLNATGDKPIRVVNLSGDSKSFTLQQSISDFKLTSSSITLPTAGFYVSVKDSTDGKLVGSTNINIFKQNGVVLRSGAGANGTMNSGAVTAQLRMNTASQVVVPGTYRALLTSTLVTGP